MEISFREVKSYYFTIHFCNERFLFVNPKLFARGHDAQTKQKRIAIESSLNLTSSEVALDFKLVSIAIVFWFLGNECIESCFTCYFFLRWNLSWVRLRCFFGSEVIGGWKT